MSRLPGGLIDRCRELNFIFDNKSYTGHPGDTLASALIANGVRLMGRSFKYHRPRGPFTAGSEEPNALVELREDARREPNTPATVTELYEGLVATSQNRFATLRFDALAINDLFAPLFAAGFYYKTFMWPSSFWERVYEPIIRKAAGLGSLSMEADPDAYDKGFLHCDLLVIGGGPAGLAAALAASRAGARVILADEDFRLGGRLLSDSHLLDDAPAQGWIDTVGAEFAVLPNLRVMRRTTVFGVYDHGIFGAVEQRADHLPTPGMGVRQTLWRITAKRAILAAGAHERHIPFANNDRPGIMLAGAMRAYANRWAVTAADKIAVFTNNLDGHRTAIDLAAKGVEIAAVVDTRSDAKAIGDYPIYPGATVTNARGRLGLASIDINNAGKVHRVECGALGVSGGWSPNVHLASHHRARPVWKEDLLAFVPGATDGPPGLFAAGACSGKFSTHGALKDGARAAQEALLGIGIEALLPDLPSAEDAPITQHAFWHVSAKDRAWVDFQNDVTVKDIELAHKENMRSVEHLKRWTTLGMATDQGKSSNVTALAVMASMTGKSISETGTTIFRPPYTGVSIGVLGGGDRGANFRPRRLTPTHEWAEKNGAEFVESGSWMRAQFYRREGETHARMTVDREAATVRSAVGICDVTSLGKIDVQGKDAGVFLDRIYVNPMTSLASGKMRYGLMLREDGFAYDDGACARFAEDHYVLTTTTANAGLVYRNMEFARQCLWPDLDVQLIPVTDTWAQIAVAGPKSRVLLSRLVDDFDLSNDAFPFMACAELTICGGTRARLFRVSFSGELAYEIAVPARYGAALMTRLIEAGQNLDVVPYGTEALSVLRIEKGHAASSEINGQTTAQMLGLGHMVSQNKDAIGTVLARREGLVTDTRRLVGLMPVAPKDRLVAGAHLFPVGARRMIETGEGWTTSACYSPSLKSYIALGFLENGSHRIGEVIVAANPLEDSEISVRVTSPHFVDPEGARQRA